MSASESRPSPAAETASKSVVTTHPQDTGDERPSHLSAEQIAESVPTYCLLVRTGSGRLNRRLYLSLAAAVKATERAQQRGHAASLELVRLVPYATGHDLWAGDAQ